MYSVQLKFIDYLFFEFQFDLPQEKKATQTGLEPATSAVTGRRANQLRYWANIKSDKEIDSLSGVPNGI